LLLLQAIIITHCASHLLFRRQKTQTFYRLIHADHILLDKAPSSFSRLLARTAYDAFTLWDRRGVFRLANVGIDLKELGVRRRNV